MSTRTTERPLKPGRISAKQAEELGQWVMGMTGEQLRTLTPAQAFVHGFTAGYESAIEFFEALADQAGLS